MKILKQILALASGLLVLFPSSAAALTQAQTDVFNNGVYYFNTEDSIASSCGTGYSGAGGTGASIGSYALDQVKSFAGEPITSTWNISDNTVEQWFLKQTNAQAVIARFGLTAGNIGQITSAIRAAGVSPVFFYIVTVNEGGGAAGFINHYSPSNDPSPLKDGPANATSDSKYIVSQSQTLANGPATGGGEPSDMPTAEAKNILDSLPLGSLGVYYIQATSAVTAELEYLSGKTGDWNPGDSASPATIYGSPLEESMQNIKTMGGDPQQGGATLSAGGCTGSVAGQGITKAVNWAVMIANNDGYGYDQATRTSGWVKWQADPACNKQCGSFDCSSFIAAALTQAGYFTTNPEFTTFSEASSLSSAGFNTVASSATSSANLQPGDILLTADHTAMYIGNNQIVEASINENGGASGGQAGDQTGREIWITQFSNDNWDGVFRAQN